MSAPAPPPAIRAADAPALSPRDRRRGLSRIADFGLTVREALTHSPLAEAQVVAGHAGLDRTMSWVHVIDHRDIEDSLVGNEFLLTSGIALADDPAYQHEILSILNRRNSAGLVVSIGVYLTEIPAVMRAEADRLGIPLIAIPWAVNFSDITRALLTRLVEAHYRFMERAQQLNQDLLELVANRGDLHAVCDRIGQALGCEVAIFNATLHPVAAGGRNRRGPDAALRGALSRLAAQERPGGSGPGQARALTIDGAPVGLAVPVVVGGRRRGWLVVRSADRTGDSIHTLISEIGATVAALLIAHDDELEQLALLRLDERLLDLLDGTLDPQSEAAAELGLTDEPALVLAAEVDHGEPAEALGLARQFLRTHGAQHALALRGNAIVGLVQAAPARSGGAGAGGWPARLVQALDKGGFAVRLAHETARDRLAGLPQQYQAVRETLRLARALRPGDRIVATHETAALARALQNLGGAALAETCPLIVRLHGQDRSPQGALIRTLSALLDAEGNVSQAARALGIHRHTMLYRVARINEILNIDLTPITRLELRLQLVVWQIARTGR